MTSWEVIGGALSGGLLVRTAKALGSQRESQRLRTGSVVEQIELDGDRLHYKLLEGSGPLQGWVSINSGGRELLQRTVRRRSSGAVPGSCTKEFLRKAASQVAQMDILAVALNVAPTVQTGPRFRVTKILAEHDDRPRVCNETLLEIAPSETAVSLEDFWPSDCSLDSNRQHYLYWAIVCSSSCDTWTMALALTLKELSDYGIILTHESRPVTNIVVLNTPTMDVGDLLPTAVELLEPESGARVSMFSTPASQLALKLLGPEVQERLGWGVSPTFTEELRDNFVERFGETSLTETVPHWWIAAIVQGVYGAYMVHIDLCGPAYGTFCRSRGFTLPGKELTLDSFITPCYLMTPYHRQQTFMVHPENMDYVPNDAKFTSVQEIRHLRCFYQGHPGYVTATPLPSFVDGEKTTSWLRLRSPSEDALDTVQSWKDGLQSIASFFRAQIFKTLEPGTYVEVDDSCENETFKGRLGKVLPDANGEEYLLQLNGLAEPARVHPMELKLYPRYVQYLTLAEMGELVALQLALLQPDQRYMPSELIGYLKRELR